MCRRLHTQRADGQAEAGTVARQGAHLEPRGAPRIQGRSGETARLPLRPARCAACAANRRSRSPTLPLGSRHLGCSLTAARPSWSARGVAAPAESISSSSQSSFASPVRRVQLPRTARAKAKQSGSDSAGTRFRYSTAFATPSPSNSATCRPSSRSCCRPSPSTPARRAGLARRTRTADGTPPRAASSSRDRSGRMYPTPPPTSRSSASTTAPPLLRRFFHPLGRRLR